MPEKPSSTTDMYWKSCFHIEANRLRKLLDRQYCTVISQIPDDGSTWDNQRWTLAIRAIRAAYAAGERDNLQLALAALTVPQEQSV